MPPELETPLTGARRRGIVRIGDTVRRPPSDSTAHAEALLRHLEAVGFDGAPRFFGRDELGREILEFLPGRVASHRPPVGLKRLTSSAQLIRRFHDATTGSALAQGQEVVCHGELGPHNTLFVGRNAVALIDFDEPYTGSRLDDLDHAAWFFVPIGKNGGTVEQQAKRLRAFCDAYGTYAPTSVIDALATRFERVEKWYAERDLSKGQAIFHQYSRWLSHNRLTLVMPQPS